MGRGVESGCRGRNLMQGHIPFQVTGWKVWVLDCLCLGSGSEGTPLPLSPHNNHAKHLLPFLGVTSCPFPLHV